jgi:hypothetical protein
VATCGWMARRSRGLEGWAGILACSYLVFFLCGKLAFCNYYFFVEFLLLLLVLFLLHRPERQLSAPGGLAT